MLKREQAARKHMMELPAQIQEQRERAETRDKRGDSKSSEQKAIIEQKIEQRAESGG
jgi:hypothetical protein